MRTAGEFFSTLHCSFERAFDRIRGSMGKVFADLSGKGGYDSLYYSSRRVIFLIDALIGFIIGYLVYAIEWSYLREQVILFIIWFLSIFNFLVTTKAFAWENLRVALTIDAAVITLSAVLSGCFKEYREKMTGTVLLAAVTLPLSWYLMFRYGIVINSFPILCVIMLTIFFSNYSSSKSARERTRISRERSSAEFAIVSHISHSVRPQILIAKAPLLSLQRFLEQHGLAGEALPNRLLNGSMETVGEALEKALTTLGQINAVVGNARNLIGREILAEDFEEVDLPALFRQEIRPLYADRDFEIVVTGGSIRKIRLHRSSFIEAINNIIRNAATHSFPAGFEGVVPNLLRFDIRENVKYVFIDYTNNGLPFPANLDEKAFLTFGRKSSDSPGEGLGGAWIAKVLEAHGGTLEIVRDDNPVHFRITLPKRNHHGKNRSRNNLSHR